MSNLSTSSNYAGDWDPCISVRPDLTDGPFVHNTKLDLPSSILTKTHCAGYCGDCDPHTYMETVDSFETGCLTGEQNMNGDAVKITYDSSVPTKAVHLIRDPFDNIVARLHLAVERRKQLGWSEEQLAQYNNSKEGLHAWCDYINTKFAKETFKSDLISPAVKELMKDVPCHADFFRYAQWHNLAIEMTDRMNLPMHYLHYEDYNRDYNKTVADLFSFLDLEAVSEPIGFIAGKTYRDYFEKEEQIATSRLVKAVASPECWDLVSVYFDQ